MRRLQCRALLNKETLSILLGQIVMNMLVPSKSVVNYNTSII